MFFKHRGGLKTEYDRPTWAVIIGAENKIVAFGEEND